MTAIASLFMYSLPETAAIERAWWQGLARHLRAEGVPDVPEALSRPADPWAHWRDPALLLAQTCGYPFSTALMGAVAYLATPHYAAEGCEGPLYRSRLIARDGTGDDLAAFRGARLAFNEPRSLSGYQGLRWLVGEAVVAGTAPTPFFEMEVETGAHRASLAAVRDGRADLCAIDAATFALIARHAPAEVAGLATIGWTRAVPGLPLITARGRNVGAVEAMRRALDAAMADPALADCRAAMLIDGVSHLSEDDYRLIPRLSGTADERLSRGLSQSRQSLTDS